jgi:hypothetical protein
VVSARLPAMILGQHSSSVEESSLIARPSWSGFVRAFDSSGQATKGAWGMSWRQKALKGVVNCDKLGGAVEQVLIPRFLNWRTLNP